MQHKKSILFLLFLSFVFPSFGQNGLNSVYSRYGLGDPVNTNFMHMRSIGNISAGYQDPYLINIVNPASLGHLRSVAFDVGINIRLASINDGTLTQGIESGNLDYISFALPLINKVNEILEREERGYNIATAFTLMPHTRVGYDISSVSETDEFGTVVRNFKGSGGSYKFLWSNSIRYQSFSFGLNLGYLFGKISYERNVFFDQNEYAFDTQFSNDFGVRGFLWNAGVQYAHTFNKEASQSQAGVLPKTLVIGLHYGTNTNMSTNSDILEVTSGFGRNNDTLSATIDIPGDGVMPGELGVGFMYRNGDKWSFGVNYATTNWSAYKNDAKPEQLSDATSFGIGGQYQPNYLSQNSYWDRVFYRVGFNYNLDARNISGAELKSYALTFGLGLPFIYQRNISHANLGFELGRRGQDTPISESYMKINFGFTFNDSQWFLKRRYD
jgi:hypothetical protein